ncbi:hypothetical protein K501DRAFT_270560 [Backusella circina FSU 941]|nr:hypothetical protein K501DRAFT_270560 [Backusella circina FSU 941]
MSSHIQSIDDIYSRDEELSFHFISDSICLGGKVARITGTKRRLHPKSTCPVIQKEKSKKKAPAKTKATKKKEDPRAAVLKAEIDELERNLKNLYKQRSQFLFTVNMKEIRKSWRESLEKDELYTDINCLKAEKNAYLYNIQKFKGDLARARQTHYRLLRFEKSTDNGIGSPRITITNQEYKCVENVENIRLDSSVNPNDLVYSGTDNGLKTMSETSKFNLDRFKFHLKPHNRYQALDGNEVTHDEEEEYVTIP